MSELWTGEFGNSYNSRNTGTTLSARRAMWDMLLPRHCDSVLEVGANIGLNLEAISQVGSVDRYYACEPNAEARAELAQQPFMELGNITGDYAHNLSFRDDRADLAFTCGVLIHVPPDKLIDSMREIHRCARRWIVCCEYFAPSEEMIPYRGQDNALWRRDYGSLWLDTFSDLHCTGVAFAWKRLTGLDNLTIWTFEKGPRFN